MVVDGLAQPDTLTAKLEPCVYVWDVDEGMICSQFDFDL